MCTVVVSFVPEAAMPLLLLGVRDEDVTRSWQPPGTHWPPSALVGARDLKEGGTWLALDPDAPRLAFVLTAWGLLTREERRRSRGELPLQAASAANPWHEVAALCDPAVRACYDPFHLLWASPDGAGMASWDGKTLTETKLGPGTHLLTNWGHKYPAADADPADLRAEHFGPRFAAARPSGDSSASIDHAWKPWFELAAGDGLDPADQRAMIVRVELYEHIYASTSVSLVALSPGRVRYDFSAVPGDLTAWDTVLST
jgi:hypothetical protein